MRHEKINGLLFAELIKQGAKQLNRHAKTVDALNVFPVPDGDTGTNMNLSFTSGVKEMNKKNSAHIGEVAQALSKGLLMGARGNSGVILSQLFRGFAKHVEDEQEINSRQFAQALQKGVDTAYQAVMKPVEGTILTVAKDAAQAAVKQARQSTDLTEVLEVVLQEARQSLQRTPDLLPILKQVGVVDSGGQGLVYVYEGFLSALKEGAMREDESDHQEDGSDHQEDESDHQAAAPFAENSEEHIRHEVAEMMHEGILSVEDITYGYCTEFIIRLHPEKVSAFDEPSFREDIGRYGDSLLVITDDDLVKVHIHAEQLDQVFKTAQAHGELLRIKIENMREQFRAVQAGKQNDQGGQAVHFREEQVEDERDRRVSEEGPEIKQRTEPRSEEPEGKAVGIITVAFGEGLIQIFKSLGADVVISGGQTMNPSTEDFVQAVEQVQAEKIIILPNNGNIVMAAKQAADVLDTPVNVVPTKNISQGMSALLSFNPDLSLAENVAQMNLVKDEVKAGEVTQAVRNTDIEGINIKQGHFMGIFDGKIVLAAPDLKDAVLQLLTKMIDEESEIVTLICGKEANEEQAEQIKEEIESRFADIEVEIYQGGQPFYPYLVSVE